MSETQNLQTSPSLLGRLRSNPKDERSWSEFVDRYGKLILSWCRRWGVTTQDAEDVTQNVLVQLARQMREFEYDDQRSFRGWLKTISYRAWCDFLESQKRAERQKLSLHSLQLLESPEAVDSLLGEIDDQAQRDAVEHAMNLVRLRVQPQTWRAFELTALHNLPGADVARELSMNIGTVYVAKSKVIRMIREQLNRDE